MRFLTLFIFLISVHLSCSVLAQDVLCHPCPDSNLPQYIIGYGSLIQEQSKAKTAQNTGQNIPIILKQYRRGWFERSNSIRGATTFLGAVPDKTSKFNAIIFTLPHDSIKAYDKRENSYCRNLVSPQNIEMLTHQPVPKGQFWIYLTRPQKMELPSAKYPIVQSYVDVFLSGCITIQNQYHLQHFATDCIDTTHNWSSHWVNDRIHPQKPCEDQPRAEKIDLLLSEKLPLLFKQIKSE